VDMQVLKGWGFEVAQHDQAAVSVTQETRGVVDDTSSQSHALSADASAANTTANDVDNAAIVSRVANTDTCSPVSVLKYIDVCITNDNSNVTKYTNALCDSGAEICVIKSSLLKDLSVDVVGQIQLRPFCGQSVNADLVRLTISSSNFDGLDSHSSIDIWCAVVPDLHDDFILTADAVSRLFEQNQTTPFIR